MSLVRIDWTCETCGLGGRVIDTPEHIYREIEQLHEWQSKDCLAPNFTFMDIEDPYVFPYVLKGDDAQ